MNSLHRKLLDMLGEAMDFDRDTIAYAKQMAAETSLCERLDVEKEQLINHLHYIRGEKLE
jgi:hypothetical protein